MEDFKPISGSCICGEIKYTIKSKPLFTHACHCKDCKKITGSSFVLNTSIFESSLDIKGCLLYTSPSPRDWMVSRMPSSA